MILGKGENFEIIVYRLWKGPIVFEPTNELDDRTIGKMETFINYYEGNETDIICEMMNIFAKINNFEWISINVDE